MKKRFFEAVKEEKGMALPIVLVLLLLGGLMIAPTLSYASTSLNAGRIVEKNVNGLYAADAGVEHALWRIKNDDVPAPEPYLLPGESVNQMGVDIQTVPKGIYTLYAGELVKLRALQDHYKFLTINGEMVLVDEELQLYQYTITVTRWEEASGDITLKEIGVRLPVGYSYQPDSAADDDFLDNLSTDEPMPIEQDAAGAYMLPWKFDVDDQPVLYEDDPDSWVATQTFYITGTGELEGDYTWVEAVRQDVGAVGEIIGTLYRITATATSPEGDEITVEADVMWYEGTGEMTILLWQINPQ